MLVYVAGPCHVLLLFAIQHDVGLNDPIILCNYDTLAQTQMTHKNESRLVQESFARGLKRGNSIGP